MRNEWIGLLLALIAVAGCTHADKPGASLPRRGDEIVACGQFFHTGTPVVLWMDPGGYDAYRIEKRFGPTTKTTVGQSFGVRMEPLTDEEVERVRQGDWTLDFLRDKVDQFVIHYDVAGLSRTCFRVLHDDRQLSVQFMLDIDGTIYQTMDLKEGAWHAGEANGRSVGVEIANMGAYRNDQFAPLQEWYSKDAHGQTRLTIPARFGDGGVRTKDFAGRPARNEMVRGIVQGAEYRQYDFTPQQYESLTKLTAALCTVFPKITCDYPKDRNGQLIPHALTWEEFDNYQGVLGHYHVMKVKQDPGPAFQWDYVIAGARKLMTAEALRANARAKGKPARFIPSPPTTKPAPVASTTPATQPSTRAGPR